MPSWPTLPAGPPPRSAGPDRRVTVAAGVLAGLLLAGCQSSAPAPGAAVQPTRPTGSVSPATSAPPGDTATPTTATGLPDGPPSGGPASGPDPDRPNPAERQLIRALRRLGVERPGRVEDEFRAAQIAGGWRGGRVYVHLYRNPVSATPGRERPAAPIRGRETSTIVTAPFGQLVQFACGRNRYQVALLTSDMRPAPGALAGARGFLADNLPGLPGCGPAPGSG